LTLKIVSFLIILTAISLFSVFALEITEIELNPAGSDTGAEWIEIYSSEQISLDNLLFINGDNQKAQFNGTFTGYYTLTFSKQWLDNSNESITITKDGQLITYAGPFKDDKNSDKTWSLCNNEWSFVTQTKGIKNSCLEQIPSNNNQSIPQQSQQNSTNSTNITNNQQTQVITQKAIAVNNSLDKTNPIANNTQTNSNIQQINSNIQQTNEESIIRLNGKSIKNEGKTFFSSQERTRLWTVYLFTFICLIIIIWLLVKD